MDKAVYIVITDEMGVSREWFLPVGSEELLSVVEVLGQPDNIIRPE